MSKRYVVSISKTRREAVGSEAKKWGLKINQYVEYALLFFSNNKINPEGYSPGKEFDTFQLLASSTANILSKIEDLERSLIQNRSEELLRIKALQEVILNIIIEKNIEPELKNQLQKEIIDYIEETVKSGK